MRAVPWGAPERAHGRTATWSEAFARNARSPRATKKATDAEKIAKLTRRVDNLTRLILGRETAALHAEAKASAQIDAVYQALLGKRAELPKVQFTVEEIRDIFADD